MKRRLKLLGSHLVKAVSVSCCKNLTAGVDPGSDFGTLWSYSVESEGWLAGSGLWRRAGSRSDPDRQRIWGPRLPTFRRPQELHWHPSLRGARERLFPVAG